MYATQDLVRALIGAGAIRPKYSAAALRNPHGPTQGKLSARPMVLSDQMRTRGGAGSRRRRARVWIQA